MAKSAGLSQGFFAHGYDIGGDVGSLNNVASPRTTLPATGISETAMHRLMGISTGMMEFNPWFNDAAGQAHAALSTLPTTDVVLNWTFGSTVGNVAAGITAKQVNYDWTRGEDGSLSGSVSAESTAGIALEWLQLLTAGKINHTSASSTARS